MIYLPNQAVGQWLYLYLILYMSFEQRHTVMIDAGSASRPACRRNKYPCANAGYRGAEHLQTIETRGYITHVADRRAEADIIKQRDLKKTARGWVVEVCRSWLDRFRKLPARYELLERSFVAFNHLAIAIIAFRNAPHDVSTIYE